MDNKENLKKSLLDLEKAWYNVLESCDFEKEFNKEYPFQKCFLELYYDVLNWVESEIKGGL